MKAKGRKHEPARLTRSFHKIKPEYAKNAITENTANGTITKEDGRFIREYVAELKATHHISIGRANKFVFQLICWRRYLKPFRVNTIGDLHTAISEFYEEVSRTPSQKPRYYKQNTKRDYVQTLKRFYLWLIDHDSNGIFKNIPRKKVEAITVLSRDSMTVKAQDLFTQEELVSMIRACLSPRDKALIMVMYEGALRPIEVASLTWGDIVIDTHGVIVNTNGKTGKPRRIRLVSAKSYLIAWRNDYPFNATGDARVFLSERGLPLNYDAIARQIQKIAKRAGITRHITLRYFRHSRITDMVRNGMSESVVRLTVWGNQRTNMLETYNHLCNEDIDREIFHSYGIQMDSREQKGIMKPRICMTCETVNAPTARYCTRCGYPLEESLITKRSQAIEILNGMMTTMTPEQLEKVQKLHKMKMQERRQHTGEIPIC